MRSRRLMSSLMASRSRVSILFNLFALIVIGGLDLR